MYACTSLCTYLSFIDFKDIQWTTHRCKFKDVYKHLHDKGLRGSSLWHAGDPRAENSETPVSGKRPCLSAYERLTEKHIKSDVFFPLSFLPPSWERLSDQFSLYHAVLITLSLLWHGKLLKINLQIRKADVIFIQERKLLTIWDCFGTNGLQMRLSHFRLWRKEMMKDLAFCLMDIICIIHSPGVSMVPH